MNYENMLDYLYMQRDDAEETIEYMKEVGELGNMEYWLDTIKTINSIIDAVRLVRDCKEV